MSGPEIVFVVHGAPTGKARPRFANGRVYTDAKSETAEARVERAWNQAGCRRLDGPIVVQVEAIHERPAAHWKKDGTLTAAALRRQWPTGRKPDVDNHLKLVMDALNGCAYRDDVDVVHAWIVKRWANPGEHQHTRVVIRSMGRALEPVEMAA